MCLREGRMLQGAEQNMSHKGEVIVVRGKQQSKADELDTYLLFSLILSLVIKPITS